MSSLKPSEALVAERAHPALPPRFEVLSRLGVGGFGHVYGAYDRHREEIVAVKLLSVASASNVNSFKREFRGLVGMHHPNLVQLYEMHEHEGQWFFTMELIRGVDLLDFVRRRPAPHASAQAPLSYVSLLFDEPTASFDSLAMRFTDAFLDNLIAAPGASHVAPWFDEARLRRALVGLFHGVTALHRAGIVHRDIKPSNVLVDAERDRVVLLDFGLIAQIKPALDVARLERLNPSRQIHYIGTPHYMSPEQAMGLEITPASDWYSLGAMLYESLSGRRPIEGASPLQILVQKQTYSPRDVRELNAEAPEDLSCLCMRLLERDVAARPTQDEIASLLGIDPEPLDASASPQRRLERVARRRVFMGRHEEIELLRAERERVTRSRGSAVVQILGASGIGKSALCERFLAESVALPTCLVLQGRCSQFETLPYKALDRLIDALATALDARRDLRDSLALTRAQCAALNALFPALAPQLAHLAAAAAPILQAPEPAQIDSGQLRLQAFDALRALLGALAETHTLVLCIDDAQWGDEDSAALLEHVLRPPNPPPLLLLLCARSEDASASVLVRRIRRALARWGEAARGIELKLKPLDEETSSRLIAALAPPQRPFSLDERERLGAEARGNPFLIEELALHVRRGERAASAGTLNDALAARIEALDERARRVLECVCVAGEPLSRALARQLIGAGGAEQRALALLGHAQLLRATADDDLLEVYHARIRDAVIAHLPRERLVALNVALADALSLQSEVEDERVARHHVAGLQPSRATPHWLSAARRAELALAFGRAASHLELALEHGNFERSARVALLERLGRLYGHLGRGNEAAQRFHQASAFASPSRQVTLERQAAEQWLRAGRFERGGALLTTLLDGVGVVTPRHNARLLAELVALKARLAWRGVDAPLQQTAHMPLEDESRERVELLWSAARTLSVMDLKLGAYFASLHLLDALTHHDPDHLCMALALEAVHSATNERGCQRAEALIERAEAFAARAKARDYCEGFTAFARGMVRFLRGEWIEAFEQFKRSEVALTTRCQGVVWELDGTRFYQFFCYEQLGQIDRFVRQLPLHLDMARARGDHLYATNWRLWSHLGLLAQDEPERALSEVNAAIAAWKTPSFLIQHFWYLRACAHIALYEHDPIWALDQIDSERGALKRSLLLQNEMIAMMCHEIQAQLSLSALLDRQLEGPQALKMRHRLEAHLNALSGCSIEAMRRRGELLAAQVAWFDGERRQALSLFERLTDEALIHGEVAIASALQMARAMILSDDDLSEALSAQARAWFFEREVASPERFARTICPMLSLWEPAQQERTELGPS